MRNQHKQQTKVNQLKPSTEKSQNAENGLKRMHYSHYLSSIPVLSISGYRSSSQPCGQQLSIDVWQAVPALSTSSSELCAARGLRDTSPEM